MILISSLDDETSTTEVIRWLKHYGVPFLRVNHEAKGKELYVSIDSHDEEIHISLENGTHFSLNDVSYFWHRRGCLNFNRTDAKFTNQEEQLLIRGNTNLLLSEIKDINSYIDSYKCSIGSLNSFNKSTLNKLTVLKLAKEVGMSIPPTLVSDSKRALKKFITLHNEVVTKPVKSSKIFHDENSFLYPYTAIVSSDMVNNLNDTFFPSLFQKRIEKKFEIRSFYLDGKIYSMAIFSQQDVQTQVDFRNYNLGKWNRNVPFRLPAEIENMIIVLMKKLGLKSGSIDFLYSKEKEYVFLEINPVGQFGMVSFPCNYYLEKKVAEFLRSKINTNEK